MHDAVLDRSRNWNRDEGIPRKPFLLDHGSAADPSSFAVELLLSGVRHVYGFTVDSRQVLEEWCYSYPTSKRRKLFRREGQKFSFGTTVAQARSRLLAEITPSNVLFMTTVHRTGQEPYSAVADWFRQSLWFLAPGEEGGYGVTRELLAEGRLGTAVLQLLQAADLGISAVAVKQQQLQPGEPAASSAGRIVAVQRDEKELHLPAAEWDSIELNERLSGQSVRFTHGGTNQGEFSISEESHGTRVWFSMLGVAVRALRGGWTVVIDEIDSSLHPLLLAEFVRLFQGQATNTGNAQLICTTHDATLLGRRRGDEILQRDQVWFTEKDPETGASSLYSLTEFSPKIGLNWERRYLGGAVGGVPFIDEDKFLGAVASGGEPSDG